jgi:hypothetical protein
VNHLSAVARERNDLGVHAAIVSAQAITPIGIERYLSPKLSPVLKNLSPKTAQQTPFFREACEGARGQASAEKPETCAP